MKRLDKRDDWLLIALAASCLALAYVFAKFGSVVLEGELRALDATVRDWTLAHRHPVALAVFQAVTLLGAKELLVPAGILLGWWLFRRTRGWLVLLVFCAFATAEFVGFLKRVYRVRRPAGGIEASMGLSFPSGHSSGSAAVLIFLAYVAIRNGASARIVVPAAAGIIVLVGLSRIYLDMHWASDVLGGWIIGGAFGVACCALFDLVQRSRPLGSPRRGDSAAVQG